MPAGDACRAAAQIMTRIGAMCLVTIGVWVVIELAVQFGHYRHRCRAGSGAPRTACSSLYGSALLSQLPAKAVMEDRPSASLSPLVVLFSTYQLVGYLARASSPRV